MRSSSRGRAGGDPRKAAAQGTRRVGAQPRLSGELGRPADADRLHRGPPSWTVGQAIDYLRETLDLPDRFYEIHAVGNDRRWQGAVSLDALLRARRPVQLADLIDKDRRRVSVMDAQEEVARLFGKYNLVTAPVLDPDNRLVGVITVDGVVDVIAEEADEEIKALGGITSDEERSDSIWTIARGRFNWLLVNLATAFLAASVLGLFKGQLEKMVALAVLAPIVASQGGNAATQTMTVAVRALATRELAPTKLGASCCVRAWSALSTAWPSGSSPVSRRLRGSMSPGSAS
jgi:magnesium transporter